ncbi:MAG TPA: TauD/TfdA family dioxygenase [Dongiaceae bacterium]|nr:TauD/TfdA family dioxygenase [Dongiaceae bacterium]
MTPTVNETPALRLRRLSGRIGAEILDVKLAGDLAPSLVQAIRRALLAHRVIFFREQTRFDDRAQEAFSNLIGGLVPHPTERVRAGTLGILELDAAAGNARADQWHTDVTFMDAPPRYSVLRAVRIPAYGGDTCWANTAAAYRDLSPELQALAESLWAIHTNNYDYAAQYAASTEAERRHHEEVFARSVYETRQPVVRIHPETGEKALLLGQFVQRFVGQTHADSQALYAMFQQHVTRLENTVRWSWREADVAIWDNQATQHYAIYDYDGQDRTMRRTTIAGEVVVGVDGRRAEILKRPDARSAAE